MAPSHTSWKRLPRSERMGLLLLILQRLLIWELFAGKGSLATPSRHRNERRKCYR